MDPDEPSNKKALLDLPPSTMPSGNNENLNGNDVINVETEKIEGRVEGILNCVICNDLPNTTLYQCRNGHLICAACFTHLLADARLSNIPSKCTLCQVEISKASVIRNLAAEKVASELPKICQFCIREIPHKLLERHEQQECPERPSKCKYLRIGCAWTGPNHMLAAHEAQCTLLERSAGELMPAIEAYYENLKEGKKLLKPLVTLLSYENIIFIDLQMKPVRSNVEERQIFYETPCFAAFGKQWMVRAHTNNNPASEVAAGDNHISYQVILMSNPTGTMSINFFVLRGPFSDLKLSAEFYKHDFSEHHLESELHVFPLMDTMEFSKFLLKNVINFRLLMFMVTK